MPLLSNISRDLRWWVAWMTMRVFVFNVLSKEVTLRGYTMMPQKKVHGLVHRPTGLAAGGGVTFFFSCFSAIKSEHFGCTHME